MAKITIDIPDLNIPETLDAFAWKYEYSRNKRGSETKAQFAKRIVAQSVKHTLHEYKRDLANDVTNQQINDEMSTIDIK